RGRDRARAARTTAQARRPDRARRLACRSRRMSSEARSRCSPRSPKRLPERAGALLGDEVAAPRGQRRYHPDDVARGTLNHIGASVTTIPGEASARMGVVAVAEEVRPMRVTATCGKSRSNVVTNLAYADPSAQSCAF